MSELESLLHLGYKLDVDFIASEDDSKAVKIKWLSALPQPTSADIALAQLPARKASKITELKIATKNAIESGFSSSALGLPHTYDSALPQDQINLLGAKLRGINLPFSCTDAQGIKASRLHTASQINQVFLDGATWIESNKAKFWAKAALVNAATTIAEVDLVGF